MKKYLSFVSLLPLSIVTMIFLTEKEMTMYTEKTCFGLLLTLIMFGLLYFMLLHMQVNRWIAIGIGICLWIVIIFVKNQLYKY